MKVLFLDIDGVLNNHSTRERYGGFVGVDKVLATRLLDWLKKNPNVKVVLSSSWRKYEDTCSHLISQGITWIDKTPFLPGEDRGIEIQKWLTAHPEVTHFVIVDDDSDMAHLKKYLVQTNYKKGLKDSHLIQIEKMLNIQQE